MPRPASNLRVFVYFKDDTVFAGEDVECTIVLKNIDPSAAPSNHVPAAPTDTNGAPRPVDPLDHLKAARTASNSALSRTTSSDFNPLQRPASHNRNPSSLSVVESASHDTTADSPTGGVHIADSAPESKHARRVSIVSLTNSPTSSQRPTFRHARSASVQASSPSIAAPSVPHNSRDASASLNSKPPNASQSPSPMSPSPLSDTSTPPPMRPSHSRSATVQTADLHSRTYSQQPPPAEPAGQSAVTIRPKPIETAVKSTDSKLPASPDQPIAQPTVFSVKSLEETPRSSVDIYSTSNHSNETLTSEYPAQITSRLLQMPQFTRTPSQLSRQPRTRTTESLMMGYVQLSGSFSLDGSLVNSSPFEEVKRKAVVGGQGGGGVVGLSRTPGESGLFGSLNWGSIGESIGESFSGFMGGSNLSSIREMKSVASSDAIPLLSTSKSILFVDLKLPPGHSKSYSYKFKLPRGLPPSHKGRAMKVFYNLIVGVQRPNNNRGQQQVRQVEVPFRVLSGVNSQGEFLGHDLMSPYIILKDQAQTSALDHSAPTTPTSPKELELSDDLGSSAADFENYVDQLLTRSKRRSSHGLLSPTSDVLESPMSPHGRSISISRAPQPLSARELIDQTIRHCSNPSSPQHIPTNFTIARASIPIASVTLSKSAMRLGDIFTCIVDFSAAKLPCYAFEATLESSEKVDPALAIRSPQSVERATRKVWARSIENALWASRCVFRAQVPVLATPGFTTTGVGLDWYIRLELVVGLSDRQQQFKQDPEEDGADQTAQAWTAPSKPEQLLEITSADDRATILTASQRLPCESFEITLPVRVFGAIANGDERKSDDSEGLLI